MDPTQRVQVGRGVSISRLGLGTATLGDAASVSDDDAAAVIASVAALGLGHVDVASEYGLGVAETRLAGFVPELVSAEVGISAKVGRRIRPATRGYRVRHTLAESVSSPAGVRVLGHKLARAGGSIVSRRSAGPAVASGRPPAHDLARQPAAVCAFSYDGVMRSFEESLGRLETARVDIAFIHEPDLHLRQAARDGYRALEELRSSGAVRAIGVAMNDADALWALADRAEYDCLLLGGRYTLLDQRALDRLLPAALARGIPILLG